MRKYVGGSLASTTTYKPASKLNQMLGWTCGETNALYVYDANGNRDRKFITVGGAGSTPTEYGYDEDNRLISVATRETEIPKTYSFGYDYRTRRISRETPTEKTVHVFDGGLSVQEYDASSSLQPQVSNLLTESIRGEGMGGGVGGMAYSIRNGQVEASHSNHRGDVVARTDGSGSVTWFARYEAYGTRFDEFGATHDRQRGNTKDEETPLGLSNQGMRWEDLAHGVWLTPDPIGCADGPNLYLYVHCNPITGFDPTGLYAGSYIAAANGLAPHPDQVTRAAGQELIDQTKALGTAMLHPIQTGKAIARGVKETFDDPVGTILEAKDAAVQTARDFVSMDPDKAGKAFVRVNEAVVGGVSGAKAMKGVLTKKGVLSQKGNKGAPVKPCFAAGTKVSTPDGEMNIEDLRAGDVVYAFDQDMDSVTQRTVLKTFKNFTYYWVAVEVEGRSIQATRFHKFWVESERAWLDAISLEPGMVVLLQEGSLAEITAVSMRELDAPEDTYNLLVDVDHNYFVGADRVLVHNGYPEKPKYPPSTKVGENFQMNYDTSPDYSRSRAAGVRRARATGQYPAGGEMHHANSVKTHPHLAAEPDNAWKWMPDKKAHLDAHGGNFKKPTKGPLRPAAKPGC